MGAFDWLKSTNDWLEEVPENVTNGFDNFIGTGEHVVQEKVDIFCEYMAWKTNRGIERVRQGVIKALHAMYQNTVGGRVAKVATAVTDFIKDPIGAVGSFADAIGGPVKAVKDWGKVLIVEIPRLAKNIANIVSTLPPQPPNPSINYDKFKLKVNSIGMKNIIADPSNLPSPEVMFPEPDDLKKPFSAQTFQNIFDNTSAGLKSTKLKYTLSPEDTVMMENMKFKSLEEQIIEATSNSFDDLSI